MKKKQMKKKRVPAQKMMMPKAMKAKARKMGMYALLFFAVMFSGFNLASAYSGTAQTVIEHVENFYGGAPAGQEAELGNGEELLGASANRPIRYVYDYVNGFFVSGSQIFDSNANATLPGTLAVTGATTLTGDLNLSSGVLYVDASEYRVGINTTTLTHTFQVASSTGDLWFYVSENGDVIADTDTFAVDVSADEVGIGNTDPSAKLDIKQTAATRALFVNQDANAGGVIIDSESNTETEAGAGFSVVTGQGAPAIHAEYGSNANGFFSAASNPNSSAFAQGTIYVFRNLASSSTAVPLVYLDQTSATDDQRNLHIIQDAPADGVFVDHNNYGQAIEVDMDASSASDATGLWVNVANAGAGGAYAAIFEAGHVGIGTTTPNVALHVLQSVSTTVRFGGPTQSGCIELGDSDSAGISYITVLNGTLAVTSTLPAACRAL